MMQKVIWSVCWPAQGRDQVTNNSLQGSHSMTGMPANHTYDHKVNNNMLRQQSASLKKVSNS